jgi:Domain of unknown function (DUF222)/HNH endonuclease
MLATQDVCALTTAELAADDRRERLIRQRHVIDLMELSFSQEAAEFAATNDYEADGSISPIDWIRINCHMTGPSAADRVAVGQLAGELEQTVEALAYGQVGFAHLTVMARTANAIGTPFDETALLDKARENSPGKFHHLCRHYRHAADPKGYAAEQAELVENRRLSLSTWDDGSLLLNGVLDPVGGAALRTALEPLARKSGAHDDRNRERRLADALVELASGGEQRAQIQVTSSLETLLGLVGAPAAEMEFSLPISSETIKRLACDSSIARVLLGSESMVIDVGRSKRVVSGPGRRALKARDGSCRWPGCERPASWSAAHHVVHWIHGGTTDLDNLILLCHRHHWMVHEGKWQIVRSDDGRILTIPPTVTFGPPARGPD